MAASKKAAIHDLAQQKKAPNGPRPAAKPDQLPEEVQSSNGDGWAGKHPGHPDHDPADDDMADGSGNTGGTYGVMKKFGDGIGLNKLVVVGGPKGAKAQPAGQAIQNFLKAKNPKAAWSSAIFLVAAIGGTVISITAVGTYFVAKAENKKLKKAKKRSNLLGGRYGSVKKDPDIV